MGLYEFEFEFDLCLMGSGPNPLIKQTRVTQTPKKLELGTRNRVLKKHGGWRVIPHL